MQWCLTAVSHCICNKDGEMWKYGLYTRPFTRGDPNESPIGCARPLYPHSVLLGLPLGLGVRVLSVRPRMVPLLHRLHVHALLRYDGRISRRLFRHPDPRAGDLPRVLQLNDRLRV